MALYWLEEAEGLGSAPLTVQAQAIDVVDVPDIAIQPGFFPFAPTDSVKLRNIYQQDFRPVSDFREWNARGRLIPDVLPKIDELEMVPIEGYDAVGEREQQAMEEASQGEEAVYRRMIMRDIPGIVNKLVLANYRRVEMAAAEAWAKGQITVRHPHKNENMVVGLNFDAARISTAATAWNDASVNAFELLQAYLRQARRYVGNFSGVLTRQAVVDAIIADAPNAIPGITQDIRPTQEQVEDLVRRGGFPGFQFVIHETGFDVLAPDGGIDFTRTDVWPDGYLSVIPTGRRVGTTYRAPNVRASDLSRQFPLAKIDRNGMAVVYEYENAGRTAKIECQANWLPLPQEQFVFSINTLVTGA